MLHNLVGLISAPLSLIKRAFIQWFVWDSMLANNSVDCRLKAFHLRIDCPHISSAEARHWSIDLSQKAGLSPASLLGPHLVRVKRTSRGFGETARKMKPAAVELAAYQCRSEEAYALCAMTVL